MKVSLRKAAAIQSEIKNYLSQLEIKTDAEVPVNIDEAVVLINKYNCDLKVNISNYITLLDILSSIRINVATANTLSGISELLTKENILKQKIKTYESLKNSKVALSEQVLKLMIEKNLSTTTDAYYGRNQTMYVTVPYIHHAYLESIKEDLLALKREKNKISESLLALNVRSEIEIEEPDYTFLLSLGLV